MINRELANFSEELAERPQLVAANKCDMADEEQVAMVRAFVEEQGYAFYPISAATNQGTHELIGAVASALSKLPPVRQFEAQPLTDEERRAREMTEQKFTITVEDGVYYVDADFLEPLLMTVNMDDYESLQYFQRMLRQSGIIDALEEKGIEEGDTVSIFDFQFDFVK